MAPRELLVRNPDLLPLAAHPFGLQRVCRRKVIPIAEQKEIRSSALSDASNCPYHVVYALLRAADGQHPHLLDTELFQVPLRRPTVVIRFQFPPDASMIFPAPGNRYRSAIKFQEKIDGGLIGKCQQD